MSLRLGSLKGKQNYKILRKHIIYAKRLNINIKFIYYNEFSIHGKYILFMYAIVV